LQGAVLAILALTAIAPAARAADEKEKVARVAHIRLSGDLGEEPVSSDPLFAFGGATENLRSKLDRIRKAKNDKEVKALYLQFDGLAIGWGKADELRKAITDFRASGKKVYGIVEEGMARDYLVA